ncbi:MAG TPA: RDD family protein [Candidatus Thermoplasmatota archaeon]
MPTNVRDPRTLVTPDEFEISPHLLGLPLASPWRRLGGILVDLALIGILTALLSGVQLLLWGTVALVLLHIAARRPARTSVHPHAALLLRIATGCLGTFVLLVVLVVFGATRLSRQQTREARALTEDAARAADIPAIVRQALVGAGATVEAAEDLRQAEDDLEADEAAIAFLEELPEAELSRAQLMDLLLEMTPDDAEWRPRVREIYSRALDSVLAAPPAGEGAAPVSPSSDAGGAGDGEVPVAAGGSGFVALLRDVWEQLGSAIGLWSIYFTVLLTLGRGQTVGKRLFGTRVVRLDGEPMTWWSSFERGGGYAAGIATGLLGFAQVFWDANRQCVHDKIVGTVVVLSGAGAAPGAVAEARSATSGSDASVTPDEGG